MQVFKRYLVKGENMRINEASIREIVRKIIEEAKAKEENNPLDDPENPDVPKGGRWGLTGMGQTPEMFRTRTGVPGLNASPGRKIKPDEAEKAAERINQVKPDEVIGYSRGAALFNAAAATGKMKHKPAVTYMAPSSYRKWSNAPVPKAPAGSKVIIGDKDDVVPIKQAAKNAIDANAPLYILPGFSHTGIMYSKGEVTPGGFEVDPESILDDETLPDWGPTVYAKGGKDGDAVKDQAEKVRKHRVSESQLRLMIREALVKLLPKNS